MKKRVLSLVLAICLMVVGLPLPSVAASGAWDGTSKVAITTSGNTYMVSSGAELAWIADQNNNGNRSFEGKTILLTDDIDLNNKVFTPIGTESKPFKGSFDGQGHIITGLKIQQSANGNTHGGLFGYVSGNDLSFSGVTLSNCSIDSHSNALEANTGALIGKVQVTSGKSFVVEEVVVSGNMQSYRGNFGGLIGQISLAGGNSVVLRHLSGGISMSIFGGEGTYAGLVGYIADTASRNSSVSLEYSSSSSKVAGSMGSYAYSKVYSGGLFGKFDGGTLVIDQCAVTGSVSSKAYYTYCGGFVGSVISNKLAISDSYVNATLSAEGTSGEGVAGGFLGGMECKGTSSESYIRNCYVTGAATITATQYTGVGYFIARNWEKTDSIFVENCYYNSSFSGNAESKYKVCNVYFGIKEVTSSNISGSYGRSAVQMKQASYYSGWDFAVTWMSDTTEYPQLRWKYYADNPRPEREDNIPTFHGLVIGGISGEEKAGSDNSSALIYNAIKDNRLSNYYVSEDNI